MAPRVYNGAVCVSMVGQWFGNLVTMEWWDDLWLNEGFASYVEYLGVNHVHPNWLMVRQLGRDSKRNNINFIERMA